MHEVNQMVNDLAVEVNSADPKLDQIVQNATAAKQNTRKAAVEIAQGAEYQKKSYRKMYRLFN
jgi:t-SNARE complex subunit (syntaxin)